MADTRPVKVRVAPSPTGFLHVGTAQSALFNWLFAHVNKGNFFLRIEDTDKERSTKEYERSILEALKWLGLDWDGEVIYQSDRTPRYCAALEKLLAEGKAFYCHHSQEELESERKAQETAKEPPRHVCSHKNEEKGKEAGGIIRFNHEYTRFKDALSVAFRDVIRGDIAFDAGLLGDFSIAKSLDEPLYNFAVVIDDADMEISTVIRGEDHISNTPKQILIYVALGLPVPQFAHLPLMLAADRSKLSKRHGATAVIDYKKDYLPDALINFLGALSYTFSKEILSKEEMLAEFDLAKVHRSGAVFDVKKLNWINSQYIKSLSPAALRQATGISEIPGVGVPLITERLEKLSDAKNFAYLWQEPEYPKELLLWKTSSSDDVKKSLADVAARLSQIEWQNDKILAELETLASEKGNKGLVFWPLRVALSGKDKSPGPVEIALVIGKEKTLARIKKAVELL